MTLPDVRIRITADDAGARATFRRTEAALEGLEGAARNSGAAMLRFRGAMGQTVGSSGAFARGLQNAGFQVGDFATQVAGGTRASVALAQQLPQLLGSFGAFGAVAGAAVAVLAPLASNLFTVRERGQEFSDALGNLTANLDRMRAANESARLSVTGMVAAFGASNPAMRESLSILAQIAEADAAASVMALSNSFRQSVEDLAGFNQRLDRAIAGMLGLSTSYRELPEAVARFQGAMMSLETADSFPRQAAAAASLRDQIIAAAGGVDNLNAEQRELVTQLSQIVLQASAFRTQTEGAVTAATVLSERMKAAYAGYASTRLEAEALAAATERAATAASLAYGRLQNTSGGGPDAVRSIAMGWNSAVNPNGTLAGGAGGVRQFPAAGGGGGGAGIGAGVAELSEAFRQVTADMTEFAEFSDRTLAGQLGAWGGYFGDLANLVGSENEKLLAVSKSFAAANALINAWEGYTQTLREPGTPWYLKLAAGAKVLAAGLGAVNAIKSVGKGGSGGRAAGGGAGTESAAPQAQAPGQVLTFNFLNTTPDQNAMGRWMVEQINRAVEQGARIQGVRMG